MFTRHRESLLIALQSLALHKTRSLLTMLGIIFGVGAVISMLSIGEGARQESLEQIEVLGVRNIIVRSVEQSTESEAEEDTKSQPLGITLKDADAIAAICGFAEGMAVTWESKVDARTYEGSKRVSLVGATPAYAGLFNARMSEGTFLGSAHLAATANVCVIGNEIRQALFGFKNPMYQLIKLQDQWFTVIGVMESKKAVKSVDIGMPSANSTVLIPLTTAMAKFPREAKGSARMFMRFGGRMRFSSGNDAKFLDRSTIDQIALRVDKRTPVEEAAKVVTAIIRQRHNDQLDFTVTIPDELIAQSQKTQSIFNIVMGAIAGISLLVGGIGIMNIMLASVLERTREIGVRRAIGATRTMIIVQFLFEATFLSIAGGMAGILLGWGLTKAITLYAGWRTIISLWSIVLAFGVAGATGVLFGYYPAKHAADEDVIEALRYE